MRATQNERHATLPPAVTNLSECSSGMLQGTPHIVGLVPSVPGHELTGCQVIKLLHCNEAPFIRTAFLKQSFSIVLECFVTQSVVHNLTEIYHRSDSRDWVRVQRIQLRDTCFRYLRETMKFQFICIISVLLLALCFELLEHKDKIEHSHRAIEDGQIIVGGRCTCQSSYTVVKRHRFKTA